MAHKQEVEVCWHGVGMNLAHPPLAAVNCADRLSSPSSLGRFFRQSGPWPLVPINYQNPFGVSRRIAILFVTQGPDECPKTNPPKSQRNRDKPEQNIHYAFIRMAFSETVIDDTDIATADISGVAKPSNAKGTATIL